MLGRVCRRQWEWRLRGWFVLLTIGGAWGLGFMAHSMRYNGIDIYFGPVVLTVQPPMPMPMRAEFSRRWYWYAALGLIFATLAHFLVKIGWPL